MTNNFIGQNMAKKIFSIILFAVFALSTKAQTKEQKAFDETMANIAEMDQMLLKDFKQITSALEAVDGAIFTFGDCIVLGAYADESFKKQCKTMEDEMEKTFSKSIWSFDKYNANSQSAVKVKTIAGKSEQSPYAGFAGSATIKIGMLIEGLEINAYFYQSKADKKKYIMMFPVSQMGVFVEMTKKDSKVAGNNENKNTAIVPAVKEDSKASTTPLNSNAKNNTKKTTPTTTKLVPQIIQPKQVIKNVAQPAANKVKAALPIPNANTTKDKTKNALKSKLKL